MKREFKATQPDWAKFAETVEYLRSRANITQRDAALRASMSGSQYNRLVGAGQGREGRGIERPSFVDVVNLGGLFGITPNQIAQMVGMMDSEEGAAPTIASPKIHTMLALLDEMDAEPRERLIDFLLGAVSSQKSAK